MSIVSVKELENFDKEKNLLIDIRDRNKYLNGHIPGAINLGEREIFKQVDTFKNYEKVYVYCDYGNAALRIVNHIEENYDVHNIYSIIGGYYVYRGKIEKN